jgi:hypothetical protein
VAVLEPAPAPRRGCLRQDLDVGGIRPGRRAAGGAHVPRNRYTCGTCAAAIVANAADTAQSGRLGTVSAYEYRHRRALLFKLLCRFYLRLLSRLYSASVYHGMLCYIRADVRSCATRAPQSGPWLAPSQELIDALHEAIGRAANEARPVEPEDLVIASLRRPSPARRILCGITATRIQREDQIVNTIEHILAQAVLMPETPRLKRITPRTREFIETLVAACGANLCE